MKATQQFGQLTAIPNCSITIDADTGPQQIEFFILPDITDTKSANYQDENIMGRATTVKSYDSSGVRAVSMELHFIALKQADIQTNLGNLRLLQAAVYPRPGQNQAPYLPPPICQITCGKLLGDNGICAILRSYNVRFDTTMVFDEDTLLPYKFDVSTQWEVVYSNDNLPGADKIAGFGS